MAWKVEAGNQLTSPLDLNQLLEDGTLYWDVPQGYWKIFVLFTTHNGDGRDDYINMLDKESCYQQISRVYEPHYAHYKHLFGKPIAGFFSYEPAVGNTVGCDFDESIGRKEMALPWSKYVHEKIQKE